jgi:putative dimethyl sulfoxide reductase chaperone
MHISCPVSDHASQAVRMARADCCRLFAACFYPPDKKLFVEETITQRLSDQLQIACPEVFCSANCLAAPHLEGDVLSIAYTRLFLGAPEMLAPPYASFYLDRESRLMGPTCTEIVRIYKSQGLRIVDDFHNTLDHVAVVLEFLYYLLFQETKAQIEGALEEKARFRETRTFFWNKYIVTWIPRFCARIVTAGAHPFYSDLARCLDGFVRCDAPGAGRRE